MKANVSFLFIYLFKEYFQHLFSLSTAKLGKNSWTKTSANLAVSF